MRAFVAGGFAIISTLLIISLWAGYCTTCCNGQPCNPAKNKPYITDQDPGYWRRVMCSQPRYRDIYTCKGPKL